MTDLSELSDLVAEGRRLLDAAEHGEVGDGFRLDDWTVDNLPALLDRIAQQDEAIIATDAENRRLVDEVERARAIETEAKKVPTLEAEVKHLEMGVFTWKATAHTIERDNQRLRADMSLMNEAQRALVGDTGHVAYYPERLTAEQVAAHYDASPVVEEPKAAPIAPIVSVNEGDEK